MNAQNTWREFFAHWPPAMAPTGVAVTVFDEQIPFVNYSTGEELVVLYRRAPDTIGARAVVIPYANIQALKVTEVIDSGLFHEQGFAPAPTAAKCKARAC